MSVAKIRRGPVVCVGPSCGRSWKPAWKILIPTLCLLALLAVRDDAYAVTTLDTQDYDLFFGDFNGDGKTDVLYIAKDPTKASGIDISDGTGPDIAWQSWPSNYLNIPWSTSQYNIIVADFNGDGKADILMQSIGVGDSYLLITAANGMVSGITQTLAAGALGAAFGWNAGQHHLVAGDFNHDGRADVFLQAVTSAGSNAVVFANADGTLTTVAQSWSDNYLGFKWGTSEANIFAGDFNGDGYADLLIQAKPRFVIIPYDVPVPIPTYPPNLNGVVLSQGGTTPFVLAGVQAWSRISDGVDWSPLSSNIIVGSLTGNGRADVVLQGRSAGRPTDEVAGNASGSIFGTGVLLASNVTWTANSTELFAVNFNGVGTGGLYLQAENSAGTNYYATGITAAAASLAPLTAPMANEMITYSYDALGRLTVVAHSGAINNGLQASYSYDGAGNRTGVSVTGSAN
jgi:hypothetical protein